MPIYIVQEYDAQGSRVGFGAEIDAPSAIRAAVNVAGRALNNGHLPGRPYYRVTSKEDRSLDLTFHPAG